MKKLFKQIKLICKIFVAAFKVSKVGGNDMYLTNKIRNNEFISKEIISGIPVYYMEDDTIVLANGFRFGMVTQIGFTLLTREIVIITENETSKLGISEFVRYHELGHIYNEIIPSTIIFERGIDHEIAADMYAVSQLGKEEVIRSLRILGQQEVDVEEIKLRIKAIQENC